MTRLAESKNRLAESKANFNRLAELFLHLAESMHMFIQLVEYTHVTRRVPLVLNPYSGFLSHAGAPIHRSTLLQAIHHVKWQTLRESKEI